MERVGVMGGTFDPIHNGHVVAGVEARRALGLDVVLFVPAGEPWQKRGHVVAPAKDRLEMVAASVAGIDGLEASAIEVERTGPTYTADTLASLRSPDRDLFLIVGADVATTLHTWVGIERIPELACLVVVDRAGEHAPKGDPASRWRVERVAIPRLDISSSDIRDRAASGWPLDGLVPSAALRILTERCLYANQERYNDKG